MRRKYEIKEIEILKKEDVKNIVRNINLEEDTGEYGKRDTAEILKAVSAQK